MDIKEIKKCPNCKSTRLEMKKNSYLICKKCLSKIGITNGVIWYEYSYSSEKNEHEI